MNFKDRLQTLLDPERRRVYDVYGEEGLQAGLQVSTFVHGREDLRDEWQRFRINQVPLNARHFRFCNAEEEEADQT